MEKKGKPVPTNDIWIAAAGFQHGLKLFSGGFFRHTGRCIEKAETLKQASIDTDMEKVDKIIMEIRVMDPELADSLAVLAEEFEYGKILDGLEGLRKSKHE